MATSAAAMLACLVLVRFSCLLQRPGEHRKVRPYLPVVEQVLHCHLIAAVTFSAQLRGCRRVHAFGGDKAL